MAGDNVELAHETVAAVGRMDVARLIELTHPEVEWRSRIILMRAFRAPEEALGALGRRG